MEATAWTSSASGSVGRALASIPLVSALIVLVPFQALGGLLCVGVE